MDDGLQWAANRASRLMIAYVQRNACDTLLYGCCAEPGKGCLLLTTLRGICRRMWSTSRRS